MNINMQDLSVSYVSHSTNSRIVLLELGDGLVVVPS